MLTQIYTPSIRSIQANRAGMVKPLANPIGEDNAEPDENSKQSALTTAALKEQAEKGVITIKSVIADFHSTMDALGVPDPVRQEVTPYLQVIAHQSQKDKPATNLIKHNLRASASVLDDFISSTLNQKSNVVKEWVDALLLQQIDYKSSEPITVQAAPSGSGGVVGGAAPLNVPPNTLANSDLSKPDQAFIKETLQKAKGLVQSKEFEAALGAYQVALNKVDGANLPEVQGQIHYLMGKTLDKSGDPKGALDNYMSADSFFSQCYSPKSHLKVQHGLANLYARKGDLYLAQEHWTKALNLEQQLGDEGAQSRTLNELGMNAIRQGQADTAQQHLQAALDKARTHQPEAASDILSNLAALSKAQGKRTEAFGYYKQALEVDQQTQNKDGMRQTLQNLASLYLDSGKPDKAYKMLEKALYSV